MRDKLFEHDLEGFVLERVAGHDRCILAQETSYQTARNVDPENVSAILSIQMSFGISPLTGREQKSSQKQFCELLLYKAEFLRGYLAYFFQKSL